jgi:two-component system NtrC family sensor kinase
MDVSERLHNEKIRIIENLTGVDSSKLNYYLEAKKRSEEIIKQNHRLEIIYQIIQDINIDMSLEDIITRVHKKLPQAIHCDFWGLAMLKGNNLYMTAMVPGYVCVGEPVSEKSLLWESVTKKESKFYHLRGDGRELTYPPVKQMGLKSMVVSPLTVKGNVIGVLIMGSKISYAYGADEIKFIDQLAGQLAICMENSWLYEQVLRGKKEWEETFKAVTDPIFLIDLNCNVLRCNGRVNSLPGGENSVNNKKCYSLLWNHNSKCSPCLMDKVLSTRDSAYERMQISTGMVYDVFYYPVFNESGEIYAVIHHIKDVTEQCKMEAQLMQSGKLAAIGEMAAGVAHELNSPMTAIIGNAQMLLRDLEEDNPRADYVKDIVNCGLRCKKIIQNLLTFSRQDERPMTSISLNDVVERVLSLLKYQINRNNIKIETGMSPCLPTVQANGHQLDQVLINFLLNARDALEGIENSKRIDVYTGITELEGEEAVHATVVDNGEGIPPECMEKIFNPFFTTKEVSKGTGLGLSVSLGIAQAHGGTIRVNSKPGKGSTFSLVLPVEKSVSGKLEEVE